MAYCTQDDIQNSGIPEDDLIQLTDDNDQGVVDAAVVAKAISRADEMIDGYLRSRYDMPLNPVPGMINLLAIDLAIYFIYGHRPHIDTPDRIVTAFNNAKSDLKNIQNGTMQLGVDGTDESMGLAVVSNPGRVFNKDTLQNF